MVDQTMFSRARQNEDAYETQEENDPSKAPALKDDMANTPDVSNDPVQQSVPGPALAQGGAIPDFNDGGAQDYPGGFGGGSPDEQPSGQSTAIPETPEWGQSLGQDVRNVGSAVKGAVDPGNANMSQVSGSEPQMPDPNKGTKDIASRIMNYLKGADALPQQQWDALQQQVDPQGTMDQSERTMRAIDHATEQDPDLGAAAVQHARVNYDLYKANAAKALANGNAMLAAQEATAAQNFIPDGSKTVFAPKKDGSGFIAQVQSMNGNASKFELTPEQFNSMLRGEHSLFDHAAEGSIDEVIQAAVRSGGHPISSPTQNPNTDQGQIAGTPKQFPGNQPAANPAPTFDPATAKPLDIDATLKRGQPVSDQNYKSPGDKLKRGQQPAEWKDNGPEGGGTGYWTRKPTYTNPDERTPEETPNVQNVTSFGVTSKQARDIPIGDGKGGGQTINQRNAAGTRAAAQEYSADQRRAAQENAAGVRNEGTHYSADQRNEGVHYNADRRHDDVAMRYSQGDPRPFQSAMKAYTQWESSEGKGATPDQHAEKLRSLGIDPDKLRSGFYTNPPAGATRGPQPQQQPAQVEPNAPVAVNPKTGQRLILSNGKWIPHP